MGSTGPVDITGAPTRIKIRLIQVRHEESAAFWACGYAKFTGRLGECVLANGQVPEGKFTSQWPCTMPKMGRAKRCLGHPNVANLMNLMELLPSQDVGLDRLIQDVPPSNEGSWVRHHVGRTSPGTGPCARAVRTRTGESSDLSGDFQED